MKTNFFTVARMLKTIELLSNRWNIIFLVFIGIWIKISGFQPLEEWKNWVGCISHHEAKEILSHQAKLTKMQQTVNLPCSIDLGLSKSSLFFSKDGISLQSDGPILANWKELKDISQKSSGCYSLYDDGTVPYKLTTFSDKTNLAASLCPPLKQSGAPTLLLGGFTMHRIAGEDMDPMKDTANKISALQLRSTDRILDTCMGLGYTAIAAAKSLGNNEDGGFVQTIEYDVASLEMASYNPWSKGLFDQSLPISVLEGDILEFIQTKVPDSSYNVVIHDPPTKSLCKSDLYGLSFYKLLYRILEKSNGRLFHYIGNPASKESGRLYPGIKERLIQAGFHNVEVYAPAFGIRATTRKFY